MTGFTKFGLTTPTLPFTPVVDLGPVSCSSVVDGLSRPESSINPKGTLSNGVVFLWVSGAPSVSLRSSTVSAMSSGLWLSFASADGSSCSPTIAGTFSKNCRTTCNACCCSLAVVFGEGLC